jgi:MYXO-CTERM domain-containing protein
MNKKLFIAMSAAAAGLSMPVVAQAEVRASSKTMIMASSPTDFAPITAASADKPGRLRRTDENQPGQEMAHVAFFKGANAAKGFYFSMSTDLVDPAAPTVSHKPTDRIQLALVPIELVQDAATGVVSAKANFTGLGSNTAATGGARFVTANRGNEYRNANHPTAYAISDNVMCVEYNYQPNNTNNTERYAQCFDTAGKTLMAQTRIYQKNNDDCSMSQDAASSWVINNKAAGAGSVTSMVAWRGCNGNGSDDGWAQGFQYTIDNAAAPTKVTFKQTSDVSVCPREERSHGFCTTGTDDTTAICSWTEGNTQPQRDGVWMAAIDLTKTGQQSILWKQQIDGRKDVEGIGRTYAMRAMTDRVLLPDATTGELARTDMVVWRSGQVRGNNNTNQKGGTYYANNVAVIKATRQGLSYVVPMTDMSAKLTGLDGTHLGFRYALTGTTDALKPAIMLLGGSHFGGGYGAQMTMVQWDQATNTFTKGESREGAPYDRHLYPNYLGNNPGNQGRNYLGAEYIKNPFVSKTDAGKDQYLMVLASTGKNPDEMPSATCPDCAKKKLSAYITVIPVAQNPAAASTPTGNGSDTTSTQTGGTDTTDTGATDTDTGMDTATDPGTSLGGCSTTGGSSGAATLLLIGLAATIRRRRK